MKTKFGMLFAVILIASVALIGCGGSTVVSDDKSNEPLKEQPTDENLSQEPSIRGDEGESLKVINFAFDKSDISAEAVSALKDNADRLSQNPSLNIMVEGHCDSRGTVAYNLALGQRRAAQVKDYYVKQLGIAPERVATISYGEEKPVDIEENESAYARNRRAETKILNAAQ
ncbi:MAG: OmpA family protein [Elusimicrobiota bacterium]|nr:OmpA family protein [Elusimicrobiota bacterium]